MFKRLSSLFAMVLVMVSCMFVSVDSVEAAQPPHYSAEMIINAIDAQAENAPVPQIAVFYPEQAEFAVNYIMEHYTLRAVNGQIISSPKDVYNVRPQNMFRIVFAK